MFLVYFEWYLLPLDKLKWHFFNQTHKLVRKAIVLQEKWRAVALIINKKRNNVH